MLRRDTVALMLEARDRCVPKKRECVPLPASITPPSLPNPTHHTCLCNLSYRSLPPHNRLKTALEAHPKAAHFTDNTCPGLGANVATRKSAEEGACMRACVCADNVYM